MIWRIIELKCPVTSHLLYPTLHVLQSQNNNTKTITLIMIIEDTYKVCLHMLSVFVMITLWLYCQIDLPYFKVHFNSAVLKMLHSKKWLSNAEVLPALHMHMCVAIWGRGSSWAQICRMSLGRPDLLIVKTLGENWDVALGMGIEVKVAEILSTRSFLPILLKRLAAGCFSCIFCRKHPKSLLLFWVLPTSPVCIVCGL